MLKYTTIQGDMWDIISKKVYGDEKYMHILLDANPDLRDVDIFSSGIEINVPEIEISQDIELPPWKR